MTHTNQQYVQRALKAAATRTKNRRAAAAKRLAVLKAEVHGIEELPAWLLRHYDQLYTIAYELTEYSRWQLKPGRRRLPAPERIRICMHFSEMVPNPYACPVGGVVNWRRDPSLPMGYPGFDGYLEWYGDSALYDILGEIGVYTGSGGGGRYAGYTAKVFADDWPNITRNRTVAQLSGITDDIYRVTAEREIVLNEGNNDD